MARATRQEQVGSIGASEATAAFERIGWGFAEITRHDNGLDVFLMARDERLYDLGLTLGAQIKAGPSYFDRPAKRRGVVLGWWFRDADGEHLRDLVEHGLPQLLVLYDVETKVAYWVHVTQQAVVRTGKGSKILVPAANTVDESHREVLLAIAGSARTEVAWEGSAWSGHTELHERARLRTALIAPRLLAPHPNRGHGTPLSPPEAVAVLMQCRVDDYAQFAEQHASVPTLEEARTLTHWEWRLVGALGQRVTDGESDLLRQCIEDAPSDFQRAAALAVWIGLLLASDRTPEALRLIEAELAAHSFPPVDHEWLSLQYARSLGELGRTEEARLAVSQIQGFSRRHRDDVTAAAIDGAASQLLFRLSDLWTGEVELAVKGRDTAVSWWRQQTRSWGLAVAFYRTFLQWSRDRRRHYGRGDGAINHLLSAALTATTLGDHDDWRYLTEALGRWTLMQADEVDVSSIRLGLSNLRLAGDDEGLELVLRMLVEEGPFLPARAFAEELDLGCSTRTTARADLATVRVAAPVLQTVAADRHVDGLLDMLALDSRFVERTSFRPAGYNVLDALTPLMPVASAAAHSRVIDAFLCDPNATDQLTGDRWSNLLNSIPVENWADEQRRKANVLPTEDLGSEHLRSALRAILLEQESLEPTELYMAVRSGSVPALAALSDLREVPADVVGSFIESAEGLLLGERDQAAHGMWGVGGPNYADAVALLNVLHPAAARWDVLLGYLGDPNVRLRSKAHALHRLATHAERLSNEVCERLHALADLLRGAEAPRLPDVEEGIESKRAVLLHLSMSLGIAAEQASESLLKLASGADSERAWSARLAGERGSEEDIGLLAALSRDTSAKVRGSAGAALVRLLARGRETPMSTAALDRLLLDPGVIVPTRIAEAIAREGADMPELRRFTTVLATHPISAVRDALSESADYGG